VKLLPWGTRRETNDEGTIIINKNKKGSVIIVIVGGRPLALAACDTVRSKDGVPAGSW
jgi:hypothetical protein